MPPWGSERTPGPILTTVIAAVAIAAILILIVLKFGAATATH